MSPDTLALATRVLAWITGSAVALYVLDRVLSWMERRGWIYYRRTRAGRGAATYHLLEMSSILDPSMRVVQEVRVKQEQSEDEVGDPLGGSGDESAARGDGDDDPPAELGRP